MIFVTVGTERFPFDRLVSAVDGLKDVFQGESIYMQIGSGTYIPSCPYERFITYGEFCNKIREARIVISHAGAGTLLMCSEYGKIPIMMPRKQCFAEHVDDHQRMLADRMVERGRIILADNSEDLKDRILQYDQLCLAGKNLYSEGSAMVQHLRILLKGIDRNIITP